MNKNPLRFLLLIAVFFAFVCLLKNVFFSLVLMATLVLFSYVIIKYFINKEHRENRLTIF
jgi:Ca2+/Na+ antiporter